MPYCGRPAAMTVGICAVLTFSRMDSRTSPVMIMTSTAGTRPLPSARTTRRCETTPWMTAESWARIWSSWCGGKIEMMRLMVSVAFRVWRVESTRWPVSAACRATSMVSASREAEAGEELGQVQVLEGRNVLGDMAQDGANVPLAEEDVDAEAADAGHGMGEVHLLAFHEGVVADLSQEGHGRLAHEVARDRRQVVLHFEVTVHAHDGPRARSQGQDAGAALHAVRQALLDGHDRPY